MPSRLSTCLSNGATHLTHAASWHARNEDCEQRALVGVRACVGAQGARLPRACDGGNFHHSTWLEFCLYDGGRLTAAAVVSGQQDESWCGVHVAQVL